ncbi:putative licABCH operon regulator [Enterococcus casseliflavus]|uniref:Putative licABCH operon regulator n=2 Tax=Enterococcus TaxID=1350 RepID=A0A6N3F7L8_ENTCA
MKMNYSGTSERRILIFKRLIAGEHLSYQQLAEDYFVSRSSIAKDISYLKELFQKESLRLRFDNSGTFFEGSESQIHRVLKRFCLMMLDQPAAFSLLVEPEKYQEVNQAFRRAVMEKQVEMPDSYIQSIVLSIVLLIERASHAENLVIEENRQVGKLFLEFDKYPLVYELLKEIEEQHIYQFSPKEVQYLTYLIVGSGLKFFMKSEKIPFVFRGKVRNLIQKISEGLGTDLTQDNRLEEDVTIHLYQLLLRIEAQTTVINPLLEEIKQNYPALYGVVWFSLHDFLKAYPVGISDDEIGFVTIHFQAAIERMRRMNKIIFVCPNGVGTSSFVSAKIRRILPEIDSIETVSVEKLKQMDISAIDFIISTIDLVGIQKPVVRISPMVTNRDMKRIMNHYIDLVIDNEAVVDQNGLLLQAQSMIQPTVFFERFASKTEAINFLIKQTPFSDEKRKAQFQQSVIEREQLQSTYLDNGFAIPHGNPNYVEKTAISILLLDQPVEWGNQKADIIILLMIREDETQKVEPMMKLIMQGIENKEWFLSKMLEVKSE